MRSSLYESVRGHAATLAMLTVLMAHGAAANEDNNWMRFGSQYGSSDWQQPYDRSFVRKYESEPSRGFPTVATENVEPLKVAIKKYADIVSAGGWQELPTKQELQVGNSGELIEKLRKRLQVSGDLGADSGFSSTFDYYVEQAVKRFQARHGLTPTGYVDKTTLMALNVPASARLRQLRLNLARLQGMDLTKTPRYILVNIPAAQLEAIENNQVVSRHAGVVGKLDRQTPILTSHVAKVSFNPYWTVPPTVLREDLVPKARDYAKNGKDILESYHMTAFDPSGRKVSGRDINWESEDVYKYMFRQDPWEDNSMGFVKIHFPNKYSVFLHDTPSKSLFGRNFRADSSGCVRVQNVEQLVAWILRGEGWNMDRVAEIKRTAETIDVAPKETIPVVLAYITAWSTPDGEVQFRRDLYGNDNVDVAASSY